jgi:crossover junction endodeoxyribonuclease RuvC
MCCGLEEAQVKAAELARVHKAKLAEAARRSGS